MLNQPVDLLVSSFSPLFSGQGQVARTDPSGLGNRRPDGSRLAPSSPQGDRFEPSGEQPTDHTGPERSQQSRRGESTESEGTSSSGGPGSEERTVTGQALTEEEQKQVEELRKRDREVRQHEQAHKAAAGPHARGGPTYEYQRGPDGRRYAVGGSVQIDTSPVPGDPAATIQKMEQIRRAAMAPAEPSSQDRAVAAKAARQAQQARRELQEQQAEGSTVDGAPGAEKAGSVGPSNDLPGSAPTDGFGAANPLTAQFLGEPIPRGQLIDAHA